MVDISKLSAFLMNEVFPVLVDNIFQYSPLLHYFKENGEPAGADGGLKLQIPLIKGKSPGGSFEGDDILSTVNTEKFVHAELAWKQKYAGITIVGRDMLLSSGIRKGVSFKEANFINAELSMQEFLSKGFFDDGSGDSNKEIDGLKAIISESDPAPGAYGGIARASNTWWKAQRDHNSGTGRALTTLLIQKMYNKCSQGNDTPDLIVTSKDVYDKAWDLLHGKQQITKFELFAGTKHQHLPFNNAAIVADQYVPSDSTTRHRMYFLNSKYIKLYYHFTKAKNWGMWLHDYGNGNHLMSPSNQDVLIGRLYWMGNLGCSNPRMLGVIEDIDPAL